MKNNYEDIINLPHHVSKKHPQMPVSDRAAQFAPFAALTGYNEVIKEAARNTNSKLELSDYSVEEINRRLKFIEENIENLSDITITYFKPDIKKEGGSYISCTGTVERINKYAHTLDMTSGEHIPMYDIYSIEL